MQEYAVKGTQILNNTALSGMIDLEGFNMIAFEMPEGWAGTALTFQGKAVVNDEAIGSNEDWDDVQDDAGTEISVTVAAGKITVLGTALKAALGALRFIRIRSGTSASPVNQSPSREIRLILKKS